jgi:hypothetical protein
VEQVRVAAAQEEQALAARRKAAQEAEVLLALAARVAEAAVARAAGRVRPLVAAVLARRRAARRAAARVAARDVRHAAVVAEDAKGARLPAPQRINQPDERLSPTLARRKRQPLLLSPSNASIEKTDHPFAILPLTIEDSRSLLSCVSGSRKTAKCPCAIN